MIKKVCCLICLLGSIAAFSAPVDCSGAYVGRINIDNKSGLHGVVLLADPASTSGSSWMNFNGWDRDAKKDALSILLTSKIAKHPIDAYVGGSITACSTGLPQTLSAVHLSTNQ